MVAGEQGNGYVGSFYRDLGKPQWDLGREESTSGCLGGKYFLQCSKLDRNGD